MKLIQLDIVGLSNSQTQSGAFALVLGEIGGKRRLPIVIGNFEAKAIAMLWIMNTKANAHHPRFV